MQNTESKLYKLYDTIDNVYVKSYGGKRIYFKKGFAINAINRLNNRYNKHCNKPVLPIIRYVIKEFSIVEIV